MQWELNRMDVGDAARKRAEWGSKPCSHPDIEKERDSRGAHTGDYVCRQCGKPFRDSIEWEREYKCNLARDKLIQPPNDGTPA
jgi:hypothetical protein